MSTHFITFCWIAFSLYALIFLWQKIVVNLHAYWLACSTRSITHASYYRAAHELLLTFTAQKIAFVWYTKVDLCAVHFMSRTCFNSSHNNNWRTHACSSHASVKLDVSCTVVRSIQYITIHIGAQSRIYIRSYISINHHKIFERVNSVNDNSKIIQYRTKFCYLANW